MKMNFIFSWISYFCFHLKTDNRRGDLFLFKVRSMSTCQHIPKSQFSEMHLFAGFSFGCSSDTTRMSVIPEPHVNRKEFSNPRQTYKSCMREIKIEKHRKYKNFTNHHPIPPWRPIHCEVWRLDNCEYLVLRWEVVTGQCGGGAETGNILRRLDLTTIILPQLSHLISQQT